MPARIFARILPPLRTGGALVADVVMMPVPGHKSLLSIISACSHHNGEIRPVQSVSRHSTALMPGCDTKLLIKRCDHSGYAPVAAAADKLHPNAGHQFDAPRAHLETVCGRSAQNAVWSRVPADMTVIVAAPAVHDAIVQRFQQVSAARRWLCRRFPWRQRQGQLATAEAKADDGHQPNRCRRGNAPNDVASA
jgi:hypothetical protein